MRYRSPTAYKIARQKEHLRLLALHGQVYDPEKYPVPLEEMEEAGPVLDDDGSSFINSSDKAK